MAKTNNSRTNTSSNNSSAKAAITLAEAYAYLDHRCEEDFLDIDETTSGIKISAGKGAKIPARATMAAKDKVAVIVGAAGSSVWHENKKNPAKGYYLIPTDAWKKAEKAFKKSGITIEDKPAERKPRSNSRTESKPRNTETKPRTESKARNTRARSSAKDQTLKELAATMAAMQKMLAKLAK